MATIKQKSKIRQLYKFLDPRSPKGGILLFSVMFAVLGGGYLLWRSFAATPLTTTVLSVHASDNVNSLAVCLNDSLSYISGSTNTQLAACLQTNDPINPTKVRFGYLDRVALTFKPLATTGAWSTGSMPASNTLTTVNTFSCASTNHTFMGIGPINGNYYGEEAWTSSPLTYRFASYNSSSRACTGFTGNHPYLSAAWTSPTILCPSNGLAENNIAQLQADINAQKSAVFCLASGNYNLSVPLTLNGANIKIIGDPIRRPSLDANNVATANGKATNGINGGGATTPTLANLIVHGAPTPGASTCVNCGMGIYAAPGTSINNVYVYGNGEAGINGNDTQVDNSELQSNGNVADVGNRTAGSAGIKHGTTFTIRYSLVISNIGVGIWCDSGCIANSRFSRTTVDHNYVASNYAGGVRQEISQTPVYITSNVITGNVTNPNLNSSQLAWHGGIEAISAQHVTAGANTLSNNRGNAIIARTDPVRPAIQNAYISIAYNSTGGQTVLCDPGTSVVCSLNQ